MPTQWGSKQKSSGKNERTQSPVWHASDETIADAVRGLGNGLKLKFVFARMQLVEVALCGTPLCGLGVSRG